MNQPERREETGSRERNPGENPSRPIATEAPSAERLVRFACYRDLSPFSPRYLGEVLATDRAHAEQLGEFEFSGPVVAMRACGTANAANPALERVVARAVKSADRRNRSARFARGHSLRNPHGDGA